MFPDKGKSKIKKMWRVKFAIFLTNHYSPPSPKIPAQTGNRIIDVEITLNYFSYAAEPSSIL